MSLEQIRRGEITKNDGFVIVCMRFYPRGLKKELIDEFQPRLSPPKQLLLDFKKAEAQFGHEQAFEVTNYNERFELSFQALAELQRLSEMDKKVFVGCQCAIGQMCHREILLALAHKLFKAEIGQIFHSYSFVDQFEFPSF